MKALLARWWFMLFPRPAVHAPGFEVVESLAGNWHYHLARQGEPLAVAVCDPSVPVMRSPSPLSNWGYRGHLNERYCAQCEARARQEGVQGLGEG